ncbi:MAG TPA: circularly permuted type 2 ATP-grasp protein [Devosiaceae bacterium]
MNENASRAPTAALPKPDLIGSYRPIPGIPDEMVDGAGRVRPGWQQLVSALESLGSGELEQRFERADQYLRDAGVFYRMYDGAQTREREWPLAHVPLLLEEAEWDVLAAGIAQRAEILEKVVADIYGDNTLVAEGLLPPELVAGNPEYLRPVAGMKPAGGHFLHFCAFELGRGPDGRWWVLGDRTQAPSGAGFALENRVATTRALPDVGALLNVKRLAGFFRDFRDALQSLAAERGGSVAILTPGPHNETYFEHAYIARYLGFLLLEGEDLTVSNGEVMVRTVSGLAPVSVLWRRMDAAFMDPLEFRHDSQIGTPGLAEAVRSGTLAVVNAIGSGIVESRALPAFLNGLSRHLTGEDLQLPSVATWWCGQPRELEHVAANLGTMIVGPAFSTRVPFEDRTDTVHGAALDAAGRAALADRLRAEGASLVAQEAVSLSTAPVYEDGRLVPRPVSLRVFAARTAQGWTVMPGGQARIGETLDPSAIAMQRGGQAADVWVLGSRPVDAVSLLPGDDRAVKRNRSGSLPSRAAENLLWLGRYAERCEATVRILRAYHARLADATQPGQALLTETAEYLESLDVDARRPVPAGLVAAIEGAVASAGRIRDRFSPDGWLALTDLLKTARMFEQRVQAGDDASRAMTVLLRKLGGFSGLVNENMYRFVGWRFLEVGRRLERGIQIARAATWMTRPGAAFGSSDLLLEVGDSVMTHRRRYNVNAGPLSVIDLLVLDALNPRSVHFQLAELFSQAIMLPGGEEDGQLSGVAREALRLRTSLAIAEPGELTGERLWSLVVDLGALADRIAERYFA